MNTVHINDGLSEIDFSDDSTSKSWEETKTQISVNTQRNYQKAIAAILVLIFIVLTLIFALYIADNILALNFFKTEASQIIDDVIKELTDIKHAFRNITGDIGEMIRYLESIDNKL